MTSTSRSDRARRRPAAVLWDMDGTLVDTEPYWIECEFELVEAHGGAWSMEHAHAIVGSDLHESGRYIREHGGVDLPIDEIVNQLMDGVIARVRRSVPWRAGARDLLAQLRAAKIPCALVTMSWRRLADAIVGELPRGSFAAII
ncbi:MAG TPA: HAD family phosphatase, partial [Ilumatobacteraceae bacterium]|nr:HAD family phosphatase [Ilumatobacteraceae bacterium]